MLRFPTLSRIAALCIGLHAGVTMAQSSPDVSLFAAGSLRQALTEITDHFQRSSGHSVELRFAPSGLLREAIEQGERAEVFASANLAHPERLAKAGGWQAPQVFTRNVLCGLAQAELPVSTENVLSVMLDPAVKLGSSTPKADPSGDYAWELFGKAEALQPGAQAALEAKALQLTGGPDSPPPPAGRNPYAWVMAEGQADLFLTYCTNAVAARQELPQLQLIPLPEALQVGADYGLTLRSNSPAAAQELARYILSPEAQTVFQRYGFGAL